MSAACLFNPQIANYAQHVVGVNFGAGFLNAQDAEEIKKAVASSTADVNLTGAALDEYAAKDHENDGSAHPQVGHATVDDAAACIDHIVKVTGIDHVGIGSDFDGIGTVPRGLEDVSRMPNLTAALLRLGYSEADIQKMMGGNYLRVIREVVGQ